MTIFAKLAVSLAALALVPVPAMAQQTATPVTLSGDVKAVKLVTDADGTERVELVDPAIIVPGDRLVFSTDYANSGTETVRNFNVTNPLPAAVRLAPDADPELIVSVDGGQSWGKLAELQVTATDGTTRAATHEDVTHIRWLLASVAPGEKGRLTYPAIIR